jgi:flagellar protein FlaF
MENNPIGAYESVEKSALNGRELEAHVLMRAALMIADARDNWGQGDHEARLEAALRHNQKIWSFFQAEITQPDNPLPDEIKKNLLALSVFVDKRIFEIMAYPEAKKLDILVEINRNLAAGLRESAQESSPTP